MARESVVGKLKVMGDTFGGSSIKGGSMQREEETIFVGGLVTGDA